MTTGPGVPPEQKRLERDGYMAEMVKDANNLNGRVKDVWYGKTLRKSYARSEEILDMPNLLEIQKNSYR